MGLSNQKLAVLNITEIVSAKYKRYISEKEAWEIYRDETLSDTERQRAVHVIDSYTAINDFQSFSVPRTIEIQNPKDIEREMVMLGYCAAVIWFYDKSTEDIMEAFGLLETTFQKEIRKKIPVDMDQNIFIDFMDSSHELYKLYHLFRIAEIHSEGSIYYEDLGLLENIKGNLTSFKEGVLSYIQMRFTFQEFNQNAVYKRKTKTNL